MGDRGKICSVTVNNFITYDSVKMYCGPYLNVIIGPNGTGKSTLVAAIVIGMGGTCSTLSRGKTIVDYIKNGKKKAAVAIEIYKDDSRNVVEFNRIFDNSGKEIWRIDKKPVTQKAYIEHVRQFNIQVDNLCQFLPQDRVQDFAKMNPEEIFINTVKSVCSAEAHEQFQELRNMEKSSISSNTDITKWKNELKEVEATNEQLKLRIDNMEKRTVLLEKLQVGKIKKIHLDIEELNKKVEDCKRDLEDAKKALEEHEKKLAPLQAECKDYTLQVKKIDGDIVSCMDATSKMRSELSSMEQQVDDLESKIRMAKVAVANAKKHRESQNAEIAEETTVLTAILQDLEESAKQQPELEAKVPSLRERLKDMRHITKELEKERQKYVDERDLEIKTAIQNTKRKIADLQDVEKRHLAAMESRYPDMYKATMWLQDNRDQFRGKVYDPIIIELKLKDAREGKYLENVIAVRDLTAIVCEDTEDMKLLVKKLTKEMHLTVNVLQSKAASQINFTPRVPISQLTRFGFSKFLLDMVEGPFPILNYLCKIYQLQNIPVGNENTSKNLDEVTSSGLVNFFFTPNHRYAVAKSKYSSATSTTCIEIKGKQLLSVAVNPVVLQNEQRTLGDLQRRSDSMSVDIAECERKISWNESNARDLNVQLKEIEGKIQQFAGLGKRVKLQKRKLDNIRATMVDVEAEEEKCKKITQESTRKMLEVIKKMANSAEMFEEKEIDLMYHRDYLKRYHADNADIKARLCEAEIAVESAKRLVSQIQQILEAYKKKVNGHKNEIKALIEDVFEGNLNYMERPEFHELPNAVAELDEEISNLQAQVDCMEGRNERVIEEYAARQKKIEELCGMIANHSGVHQKLKRDMAQLHGKWFPGIQEVIQTINSKFSGFMATMGFAGEVSLTRYEYSSYGICIRVVYRNNESLQQLNSFLQSGGERTVAIATYTLALQHLSQVPFRCVDEINQGMDPKNERKIFEMLVDETSKPGMSQYFFITPKLLPGVKTNKYMVFHCVFNGPHIETPLLFINDNSTDNYYPKN
uniref:Structural maintenance of chromosomes protein 5 n=1 Tax=Lutzomyia longipalpis TaxID=7200 RepID=A0A1B0CS84_LUTLO